MGIARKAKAATADAPSSEARDKASAEKYAESLRRIAQEVAQRELERRRVASS